MKTFEEIVELLEEVGIIGTSKLKKGVSKGEQFLMSDGTIKFCHSLNFL